MSTISKLDTLMFHIVLIFTHFNEYYTQIVTSILLIVSYYDIGDINESDFHIVLIFTHF